ENAVRYCHKRHPEALDKIFDNLPVKLNQQVLDGTVAALKKDIDGSIRKGDACDQNYTQPIDNG
ncbi:MAG: hypothetical protein ACYT04_41975, partial [Nostoc sp.]